MSFISPLEALADKFNIINFNIRELLFKLGVWSTTDADSVLITLKTQDAPYFENYKIPSMKYVALNGKKTNWGNFKPEGTKNWGTTITSSEFLTSNGNHVITIDALDGPKTNFMEYVGNGNERDVQVTLNNSGADTNSMFEFILTINPSSTYPTGTHFVYFVDGSSDTVLFKVGSADLVNLLESTPVNDGRKYPKKIKVSFQHIIKPGDISPSWILFDLYQFPRYEYNVATSSTVPIRY